VDEDAERTLEHPLPIGMRDLLPEEAARRRALSDAILRRLALHGYRLVTPPAFELATVLARGRKEGGEDDAAADVVRFIDPESGEVAVLPPDITPQIARIVATRLHRHEPPFRLAYEGTVVRRRASRAKKHRQIPQVGVELCGVAGAEGDLEILTLATDVLAAGAGLTRFTIDLSDAGIARELLAPLPPPSARALSQALARKDGAALAELTGAAVDGATRDVGQKLAELVRIHGGREAAVAAIAVVAGTPAEGPARRLLALLDAACARGLGAWLSVDPAEVRSVSYYTGTTFAIYAEGPGEPVGGGGRYDDLLARYGAPRPAIGLALDLDALGWAIRDARRPAGGATGVVVVGRDDDPRLAALRARGIAAVAVADPARASAYAASWSVAHVWDDDAGPKRTVDEVVAMLRTEPSPGVRR
jgi:ATP phosphoribosyltransferase regulatory subunit